MEDICELASAGANNQTIILIAVLMVVSAVLLLSARGRHKIRHSWLAIALIVATCILPMPQAFAAEDCITAPSEPETSESSPPNASQAVLVNDHADIEVGDYEDAGSSYELVLQVTDNDQATPNDPIDLSTVRLVGDFDVDPELPGTYVLTLAPGNDSPSGDYDNVWAEWWVGLDCTDWDDIDTCFVPPTGNVTTYIYTERVPRDTTLSIQYIAQTMSGRQLAPATITVTIPPEPATIVAQSVDEEFYGFNGYCLPVRPLAEPPAPWGSDWTLDIMNLVSTDGDSPLLPSTIDLDPTTPGIQSSVSANYTGYTTSFTVDGNGVVTMTSLSPTMSTEHNWPELGFSYTISDAQGTTSNVAVGLNVDMHFNCGNS